jgi:hypothetical protein
MTTGPVPDRRIRYRVRPDGPLAVDLVFLGYEAADYKRPGGMKPGIPREKLTPGKSVIARVEVVGNESRIFSRQVDLHTGMLIQSRDHSFPCNLTIQNGMVRSTP